MRKGFPHVLAVIGAWAALATSIGRAQVVNGIADPSKDHLDRLQSFRTRILDPEARPDERRNWAEELVRESLRVPSPQAQALLVDLLGSAAGLDAQKALCEAIPSGSKGKAGQLDMALVVPLVELLGSSNTDLRLAAARALSEYSNPEVAEQLAQLARQTEAPQNLRLAAIEALAPNVYRRDVVQQLVGLLELTEPGMVSKVVAALEPAAREFLGTDVAKWRNWWNEQSKLSTEAWLDDQLRLYRDRNRMAQGELTAFRERHKQQTAELTGRLRDFQREVYRSLPADQREARLVEWLSDVQDEVKLTGLAIIKGRIADEGKRPEHDVLAAMLRLLKDRSAVVRREVLSISQNLVGDTNVVRAILAQVDEEKDVPTREAIFRAIGKLNAVDGIPLLIREINSMEAPPECVREAAIALGTIARQPGMTERLAEAAAPLKRRMESAPANDAALRGGLLTAMAGIADPSFAPNFHAAIDTDNPLLVRPAIEGLEATGDATKLSRVRRFTSHSDPLIRLTAINAVGRLGREDADLEAVLARLSPGAESNELAREAAWKAFREILRPRSVRERLRAAATLREVPDREVEYLTELTSEFAATKSGDIELELIRDRLSDLLLTQGKFAEAIPHLRELYTTRVARGDPNRLDAGLRLLDATLRSPGFANAPDLLIQLADTAGRDEYVTTRIVETVAQYLDAPETVADPARTRSVLDELRQVPSDRLGPGWTKLIKRVSSRLDAAERTPSTP